MSLEGTGGRLLSSFRHAFPPHAFREAGPGERGGDSQVKYAFGGRAGGRLMGIGEISPRASGRCRAGGGRKRIFYSKHNFEYWYSARSSERTAPHVPFLMMYHTVSYIPSTTWIKLTVAQV